MLRSVELPVSLPGLRAERSTTTSLHTGVKEYYGIGRIEHGDTEWWGRGRVWRSAPGCVLVKEPGDVVRHIAHNGPTTYTAVRLPTRNRRTIAMPSRKRSATTDPKLGPSGIPSLALNSAGRTSSPMRPGTSHVVR